MPAAGDVPVGAEEEEPIDVLDLPQLYQRPSAQTLLSTLEDLTSTPPSWEAMPRAGLIWLPSPVEKRRKIKSEGVPAYLTKIVSSPLAWIEDDVDKERIWEAASQRLSERSGRTGMGDITRTFMIPLRAHPEGRPDAEHVSTQDPSEAGVDDVLEIVLHEPALTADNLGLKTWASSYLLAKRLVTLRPRLPDLQPTAQILELGAGTGLVGLAAAAVFKTHVILTDLPEIVPNLERNLQANAATLTCSGGSAETATLDWSSPSAFNLASDADPPAHSFSLILAADPIYSPEHPRLLVQAIEEHLSRAKDARVVIELPLREAFGAERHGLRDWMAKLGLKVLDEGEEVGYDDWADGEDGDELAEVRCWWSVWGWK